METEEFIGKLTACQNGLRAFILALLPRTQHADDILQKTLLQMWQSRDQFAPNTNFYAWACQIARFKVLDYRRAMARDRVVFDDNLLTLLATESAASLEDLECMLRVLDECLGDLPARQRDLIHDRYADRRTVKQMAEHKERSASGLAVTLFRIRQVLLDCVEGKLGKRQNAST